MHGHHGWGGCGGDWGFGWIFPAILIGRLISDAFDRPERGWPQPRPQPFGSAPDKPKPQPSQNPKGEAWAQPAAPQAKTALHCRHCNGDLDPSFTFCPHCGKRVALTCRYCGQTLQPDMTYCAHCGGPAR